MLLRVLTKCFRGRLAPDALHRSLNQSLFRRIPALQRFTRFSSSSDYEEDAAVIEIDSARSIPIKEFLNPMSTDPVIKRINDCCTKDELLAFVGKSNELNQSQVSQLILASWSYQKNSGDLTLPDLNVLIHRLSQLVEDFTFEELCCNFLFLHRLRLDRKHPAMEIMSKNIIDHIDKNHRVPLQSLTQFTAAIVGDNSLYYSMLAAYTIPHISRSLEECDNADDLLLVTICLNNISHVIPLGLLGLYKTKIDSFLDQGLLNETTSKTIFKIINLLNYPHWSWRNGRLLRRLLLELEDNIKYFEARDLLTINRAFQSQLESARLVPKLVKRAQLLLKKNPDVELLSLAVMSAKPEQRSEIAELVRQFLSTYQITSNQTSETLQNVFKILRLVSLFPRP